MLHAWTARHLIVRLEDSKQATFKQLVVEGGVRYLKPLPPRYPIMKVGRKASFYCVVV
jgi:SOS-response transcriptional repressor LexA